MPKNSYCSDKDLLVLGKYEDVCILNPGQFLAALRLARLSADEIGRRYNRDALQTIQSNLCLDAETGTKLAEAIAEKK